MKKLVTIAIAALAGHLLAGTVTWTGGGDGYTWSDGNNWSSGSNPGASFTDDLVIDGGSGVFNHVDGKKVIYTSGDMGFTGSLTIKGGATLYQDADSWPNFTGTVIVENGTFDMSHATGATKYGNVTIHDGGLVIIPSSFSRVDESVLTMDGGELRIGGSFSFKPNDSVTGGSIVCYGTSDFNLSQDLILSGVSLTVYIVVPSNGAKISLDGASLVATCSEKGQFGFYGRYAGVLNFVSGSPSSYTFPSSYAGTAAALYNGMVSPGYITLDGSAISESDFYSKFDVSFDTDAGTCTMALKTLEGWGVGAVSVDSVANGEASVSFTVKKYSGGNATVTIGCASTDIGDDIANWAGKLTEVATDISSTTSYNETVTLADGINYIRVFVAYDSKTVASAVVVAKSVVYGDYGELTGVYEFIGDDNDLTKASNWVKDGQATETAPTAGTDIRWFGYNAVLSVDGFSAYATDHFVGANITSSNDFDVYSDLVFSNSTITATMFVMKEETHQFEIAGSTMVQTRTDDGWYGIYPPNAYAAFNFVSGQAASFTGKAPAGITADNLYSQHVANNNYILLDGAPINAETWGEHFEVEMLDNGRVKVSYNPSVDDNRISAVSATSTSTSATITATIGAQAAGTLVKLAYGTTAPTEAEVLSGTMMTVENATATATLSGLTEFTTYYYLVAIVDANGTGILASRAGKFVASNFSHIYDGTSWVVGGEPAWDTDASVLITGTFSTGEINPENKVLKDAVMTGTTLANGSGPLTLINSTYTNNKQNDLANGLAAYGIYNNSYAVNFTTASGNGVIKHGDAYTCYATEAQCGTVYENLFSTGKMKLNGETVTQALFESNFTTNVVVTELSDGETILSRLTITYWESVLGGGSSTDWTIQTGARVKLTKNTRIGALDIPDASDVKIDLNGYELKVSSLTIAGEKKKGEFSAESLPAILIGEGKLVVGGSGLAIFVR